MTIEKTPFEGLLIVKPTIFGDSRGYFTEAFKSSFWSENYGITFIQDNESLSTYGVVRGLHFQKPPTAQSKLVRVTEGEIVDIALDIRYGSPTFGKWYSIKLSAENLTQLFIPKGFAHGFYVLSKRAKLLYKVDAPYSPKDEGSILFSDPELCIDCPIDIDKRILSAKDMAAPRFKDLDYSKIFRF